MEKVRSYQKRRHHASRVGEQNDLQAQDINYSCDFKTGDEFSLLWEGQIDKLLLACQQVSSQATTAVHKAVAYFTHNHKRMDYARFRQQGYFIGSGTVESGGKQISTLRLKRSGARWSERGALRTAKARAAWLSGGWALLASKRAALSLAA